MTRASGTSSSSSSSSSSLPISFHGSPNTNQNAPSELKFSSTPTPSQKPYATHSSIPGDIPMETTENRLHFQEMPPDEPFMPMKFNCEQDSVQSSLSGGDTTGGLPSPEFPAF
eukprot:TRINITY_DN8618_c0_g1_i1.p1 TRINITY_DN8618_c0_g1~~TRINITY_DN8618_c0_g1_i1.p1  ORF type:complete len:121 (+),score=21.64 TRINITY_DN8618_c0_g1_i1:27-365(+)